MNSIVNSVDFKVLKTVYSCSTPEHFKTVFNWILNLLQRGYVSESQYEMYCKMIYKRFEQKVPKYKQGIYE